MAELLGFFGMGFAHIVSPDALDHVLFLVALAVVYRLRDWRDALLVVSAFTVGHSITLALAVTNIVTLDQGIVEFLIPLTIVVTSVENLVMRGRPADGAARRYRPLLAGAFGLVHGAGFAGYLRSLFLDDIAVPLLGFNLGIETGQIVALAGIGVVLVAIDALIRQVKALRLAPMRAHRLRVTGMSIAVGLVAMAWTVERRPW